MGFPDRHPHPWQASRQAALLLPFSEGSMNSQYQKHVTLPLIYSFIQPLWKAYCIRHILCPQLAHGAVGETDEETINYNTEQLKVFKYKIQWGMFNVMRFGLF